MRTWGLMGHQGSLPCSSGCPATSNLSSTILSQEAGRGGERQPISRKATRHPGHILPQSPGQRSLLPGARVSPMPS